ncbi:MAG: hypothetical protein KC493_09860 [Bacteriovoracaceae bacterium]|nr:hypothetical protein [Bacteriovoracaceae bacterium]
MYKLIIPFLLFIATVQAGVGGISGAHILFQEDSTFVNSYYNKSICHDGFEFKALVRKCVKYSNNDDRDCLKREKTFIYQPLESTRLRCKSFSGGEDERCKEWEEVNYYQSPIRLIKFIDERRVRHKTKKLIIPECN